MLKQSFKIVDGRLQDCAREEAQVLVYVKPDESEQRLLIEKLKVDEHTLASSLDPDELARLEFEPEHAVGIFKRPRYYTAADHFLFKVLSVGAFLFKDRLIVTLSEDMAIFDGTKTYTRMHSPLDVFLRMIYRSIYHFLEHLRVIHTLSDEVERSINESSDNTSLLQPLHARKEPGLLPERHPVQRHADRPAQDLAGRLGLGPRSSSSSSRTSRSRTTSASARPRSTRTFSRA